MPPLKAQFFYYSSLPIDDPLSAMPIPTGSESKAASHPPRPFSAYDNSALEEAWLGLGSRKDKKYHKQSRTSSSLKRDREHDGQNLERRTKSSATATINAEDSRQDSSSMKVAAAIEKYSGRKSRTEAKAARSATSVTSTSGKSDSGLSPQELDLDAPHKAIDGVAGGGNHAKQPKDSKSSKRDRSSSHSKTRNQKDAQEANRCETHPPTTSTLSNPSCCNHFEAQKSTSEEPVTSSNPPLRNRDDPHHAYTNSPVPPCCNDMEDRTEDAGYIVNADGSAPQDVNGETCNTEMAKRRRDRSKTRQPSSRQEVGEAQGDAADDKLSHISPVNIKHSGLSEPEHCLSTAPLRVPVQGGDAGTTGLPFIKLPSSNVHSQPPVPEAPAHVARESKKPEVEHVCNLSLDRGRSQERDSMETETVQIPVCRAQKNDKVADVPVGVSKLQLVKLPALQMQPIYWLPVNDIAAVTRGTWFYRDSMCPVEPAVANQLETGYRELRPWSQTWNDELNSAMEVGAAGEEKIAHRLWSDEDKIPGSHKKKEHTISADPYCAARCFNGEASSYKFFSFVSIKWGLEALVNFGIFKKA
jgi:hypothetical protein